MLCVVLYHAFLCGFLLSCVVLGWRVDLAWAAELAGTARHECPPGTETDAVWHSCH